MDSIIGQSSQKINKITIRPRQSSGCDNCEYCKKFGIPPAQKGEADYYSMATFNHLIQLDQQTIRMKLGAEKWTKFGPIMEKFIIKFKHPVEFIANSTDLADNNLQFADFMGVRKAEKNNYCDSKILKYIIEHQKIIRNISGDETWYKSARDRSNAFSQIGSSIFHDKAAITLAHIDASFDNMLTNPVDENGEPLIKPNALLYFADICPGSGGFSEYLLWRKKWFAKGFAFAAENTVKVDQFWAGTPETLTIFAGVDGDANIYSATNIETFSEYVVKQTDGGVHVMTSGTGFVVDERSEKIENRSKHFYLCQCLMALSAVRENGHFVAKFYDIYSTFSVGLVYLMYKCFKEICIFKPNTTEPTSSERYLICKWKKSNTEKIKKYLANINFMMNDFKKDSPEMDIHFLVPLKTITEDTDFFNYIKESNNDIGLKRLANYLKMMYHMKNVDQKDPEQQQIKSDMLKLWNVSNEQRRLPPKFESGGLEKIIMQDWYDDGKLFNAKEQSITPKIDLKKTFFKYKSTDWVFVPIAVDVAKYKSIRTFFMSNGGSQVYKYTNNKWQPVTEIVLKIASFSLFYGEIVREYIGEESDQVEEYSLHIIDGIALGGNDIREFSIYERNEMCQKFAEAHNQVRSTQSMANNIDSKKRNAAIRCKPLIPIMDFNRFFDSLKTFRQREGRVSGLSLDNQIDFDHFYIPRGLLLFKNLKPNILKMHSQYIFGCMYVNQETHKYFTNDNISDPDSIYGSFEDTYENRQFWKWEQDEQLDALVNYAQRNTNLVYRVDFEKCINSFD